MKTSRNSSGAVATFYHLKQNGSMSSFDAHLCVKRWANETRSGYAPNPLCMVTRKHLSEYYARPGHDSGD